MRLKQSDQLKAKLMRAKPASLKKRYAKTVEKLVVPNPLSRDYVGTYGPQLRCWSPDQKISVNFDSDNN
jgi:hypothetical protein